MNIFEQWTFDRLEKQGLAVFIPYKDRGVDCLIVGKDFRSTPQRIQVKGSRLWLDQENGVSNGWWRINRAKLKESIQKTDFWIFVWPVVGNAGALSPVFIVIPPQELDCRLGSYSQDSHGFYHVYFALKRQVAADIRITKGAKDEIIWPKPSNPLRNYTEFLSYRDGSRSPFDRLRVSELFGPAPGELVEPRAGTQ